MTNHKHSKLDRLKVSAPARICLFGEHQDYLNLPVIACAISLRINIEGTRRGVQNIRLHLPDINEQESFVPKGRLPYVKERDYFRAVYNVLRTEGFSFSSGFDCTVRGEIPINAGASSSSALVVSWVNFLAHMSDQASSLTAGKIAEIAYRAEVLEFSEPGGMMDQYSTAFGGVIYLESYKEVKVCPLHPRLKSFVIGDSRQAKDTRGILSNVRKRVTEIRDIISVNHPDFSFATATTENLDRYRRELSARANTLLRGTVRNHEITREARSLLTAKQLDHLGLGGLLNEHQQILRDVLRISTRKIDNMVHAALEAGAYGAKINGSGGGGCMFAYTPEDPHAVLSAIEKAGGAGYLVQVEPGVRIEEEPVAS